MSVIPDYKKVKRHVKEEDGYRLMSQWTSSQTVEMDDGTTLEDNKAGWDAAKVHADSAHATASAVIPKDAGTAAIGTDSGFARGDHVHPAQTTVSGNAGSATKLATPRNINGMSFDGSANRFNYGTCATSASTVAKTVSCTGFTLATGSEITVKFTYANTSANPTLNVNSTGAKAIYYNGSAITSGLLVANGTYTFRYNGTQWDLVGSVEGSGSSSGDKYASKDIYGDTFVSLGRRRDGTPVGERSFAFGDVVEASGDYSHAEGYYVYATGNYSHAEGTCVASGDYSHAEGHNTRANGLKSHAECYEANATGDYSHAEGSMTEAIGLASHAECYMSKAHKSYSHAEGYQTNAIGEGSHAEGYRTEASGDHSHAEGELTKAIGRGSHAEGGSLVEASGNYSHAEGSSKTNATGDCSHAEGNLTETIGKYSHSEGNNTKSEGESSHAEGSGTIARGNYSHSEGLSSVASDYAAHAEGGMCKASGNASHAEGYRTEASGDYSHAEGFGAIASIYASHAEGYETKSLHYYSHAEGYRTKASNNASHASGKYNATMIDTGSLSNTNGTALAIGNGTSDTALSNAFSVMFDGTVKAKSTITGSTTADYAEFFEWEDGNPNNEDRVGKFVTINGDKISIATSNEDYILGVVSGEPFVLGNGDCDTWNGMYLKDEFNRTIYEPAPKVELDTETGEMVEVFEEDGTPIYEGTRPKPNPDYDPNQPYISRFDRKEWAPVGMLGVLSVIHDGTCKVNGYCCCNSDGIATACDKHTEGACRVIQEMTDSVVRVILK